MCTLWGGVGYQISKTVICSQIPFSAAFAPKQPPTVVCPWTYCGLRKQSPKTPHLQNTGSMLQLTRHKSSQVILLQLSSSQNSIKCWQCVQSQTQLTSNAELLSLSMTTNSGFRVNGYRSPGCKLNTHSLSTGIFLSFAAEKILVVTYFLKLLCKQLPVVSTSLWV